ncbi:MAG: DUF2442 domain-containing protein [Candidatus Azobacteroides sp.]|nr:DUF2442 domain-containing protein [Candidatus Azobacteroides sp.]
MKIVTEYTDITHIDVIEIKSATYVGNFVIRIDFTDGVRQYIDFKPFLNHALHLSIRQYLDETKFQQFAIVDGNLNRNDYELIFPVEELHTGQITY